MSKKNKSEKASRPKIFASPAEYESFAEGRQLQFTAKTSSSSSGEKKSKKKKHSSGEKTKARKTAEAKAGSVPDTSYSQKAKEKKASSRQSKASAKPTPRLTAPAPSNSMPSPLIYKLLISAVVGILAIGGAVFWVWKNPQKHSETISPKVKEILGQISSSPDERNMSQYQKDTHGAYVSQAKILVKLIPKSQNISYYLEPELTTRVGALPAWQPFNIYEFTQNRHLREVVKTKVTKKQEGWVAFDDCFIWNTRVCIHINVNQSLYRTAQELAENLARPESERKPAFFGAYNENLLKQFNLSNRKGEDVVFALPVLFRDKHLEIWKVAMPLWDKKREYVTHYSSMWLKVERYEEWHKQHQKEPVEPIKGFVRITRSDLNRAIITIYRVINAKRYSQKDLNTLRKLSAALLIKEPKLMGRAMSLNDLYNVGAEIPMPSGLLDRSLPLPRTEEELRALEKKRNALLKLWLNEKAWDEREEAYFPIEKMF